MRICSFLPSGTEIICALGLQDQLVGVSQECDFPASVRGKPVVVRSAVNMTGMNSREIDRWVALTFGQGGNLFQLDSETLRSIQPDVILAQDLCSVCAPSRQETKKAQALLPRSAQVVELSPHTLEDIFGDIHKVGEVTGHGPEAQRLVHNLQARVASVQDKTGPLNNKPRVFVLEWLDPPFAAGHWIPEMVEIAGGRYDVLKPGEKSVRFSWAEIAEYNPDILVVAPCGFYLDRVEKEIHSIFSDPAFCRSNAIQREMIFAVDANGYFTRPGPRVVDGIELLAHLFHPGLFPWEGHPRTFRKIPSMVYSQ